MSGELQSPQAKFVRQSRCISDATARRSIMSARAVKAILVLGVGVIDSVSIVRKIATKRAYDAHAGQEIGKSGCGLEV